MRCTNQSIGMELMKLRDCLQEDSLNLHLPGRSKDQILAGLVDLLSTRKPLADREGLLSALLDREGLGSTGIGHGVAIPHGRCEELTEAMVVFARSDEEVDFDAIDGAPTRLFFLLVAPENGSNDHLHMLASIARLMKDSHIRDQLLGCETPGEALALLQ